MPRLHGIRMRNLTHPQLMYDRKKNDSLQCLNKFHVRYMIHYNAWIRSMHITRLEKNNDPLQHSNQVYTGHNRGYLTYLEMSLCYSSSLYRNIDSIPSSF